jgi:hypothetical protein
MECSSDVETALFEAMGHLGAAVTQSIPSDDQIIMGHVRKALEQVVAAHTAVRLLAFRVAA